MSLLPKLTTVSIDGLPASGSITGIGSATLTALGGTTGFNGTSANVSTGFSNITDLQGSGTLQGRDVASSFFFNDTATTEIYTLSLHDALPISLQGGTGIDTFTLGGASTFDLKGGAGVDVFALATNTLTGSIDGEAAGGSITGIGSATLTALGGTTGFNGTSANVSTGFSNITDLQGSGTLQGRD